MNEKTAATVRIRNLIVAIHEGDEEVTVSVWPDETCDDPLESVSVRYDSVFKTPCGFTRRVTDEPCGGDEDQECETCRLLDADVSKRVSPYNLVLPCGKLEVMTKNCCGDILKWDVCEPCPARIRVSIQERGEWSMKQIQCACGATMRVLASEYEGIDRCGACPKCDGGR